MHMLGLMKKADIGLYGGDEMELDAKAWQAFVSTANHGSISRAAKALHCSHSTLSRQIASLEDDLGYELFCRNGTGKKLTITREGLLLIEKANIAVQTLVELNNQAMHYFNDGVPEAISFAIPDIIPPYVEAQLATAIWQQWPQMELSFLRPSLFESLTLCAQQKVDFAIVCQEQKRLTAMRTEVIGEEALVILASPSHPLAAMDTLSIESLTPYRLFFPLSGNSGHSTLENDLFSINTCYVQQFSQGLNLARQGLGATFAPVHLAQPYIEKGELLPLSVFSSELSLTMRLELGYLLNYPYNPVANFILKHLLKLMSSPRS
ncbi:LysR family transcriptional regulator [Photobacterium swingsii]